MGDRKSWGRWLLLGFLGAALLTSCSGTSTLGYLWQAARGQAELLLRARPINDVLADPATPAEVRRKLELAAKVRAFAVEELGLPDHGSYRKYSDLGRPYVVWNVFSAPELSIHLRTRCFPVTGCVGYQGFFAEADARTEAQRRRTLGDDVLVGGITAYSTLGYFKDPILSSMLGNSDAWLVRTLIHEMSHPSLYLPGDTVFNESYATAIENEGMKRWLARYGTPELAAQDSAEQSRNQQWQALMLRGRAQLEALYAQAIPDTEKRQRKAEILDATQAEATVLRRQWFGPETAPAARPSNASLGAVAAYADLVPDFNRLLERVSGDIPAFIREAGLCARLGQEERRACLRQQQP